MSAFSERRRLPLSLAETLFHPGERAARSPPCEIKVDSKTPGWGGGSTVDPLLVSFYLHQARRKSSICMSFFLAVDFRKILLVNIYSMLLSII